MRNARRLVLLAAMALAAMALSAPAAFGQLQEDHETLELTSTATGNHCPAVNMAARTGGCLFHVNSESGAELRKHVFGIESHITTCNTEYTGRINEDGEGYLGHQEITSPPSGVCPRQPCTEAGAKHEWPMHWDEAHKGTEPKAGETNVMPVNSHREVMTFTFCIEPVGGGTDESCETSYPFNQTTPGNIEFGDAAEIPGHGFSGFRCELISHWNTETTTSDEGTPNKVTITHKPAENLAENP